MSIWFKKPEISRINQLLKKTPAAQIGIELIEIGDDFIKAAMPVESRSHETMGVFHCGASVALAGALACIGANLCVDQAKEYCAELEINASHVRQVRAGTVKGTGKLAHRGKTIQVWDISVIDQWDRLTCLSRVTMGVMPQTG